MMKMFTILPVFFLLHMPCTFGSLPGCCRHFSTPVTRELKNQGFHRDLTSLLHLPWSEDLAKCRVLVVEKLPPGVYVDPYQLARLHGNHYRVLSDVDIEAMAHDSDWLDVLVWAEFNVTEGIESSQVTVETVLPVHARYHRADDTERMAAVYIDSPQVYLGCDWDSVDGCSCAMTSLPCRPTGGATCSYQPVQLDNSPTVVLSVPLGDLKDLELVMVGTTVAVTAGCVLLLLVVLNKQLESTPP